MKDTNCIFCKIANGEIPSKTLYEDEDFRVILDLGPASKGHALILPKNHYANLYELPEETAGEVMKLAKRMAAQMTERLGCEGFNLVQNNGELAGQTVFHFHMHLELPGPMVSPLADGKASKAHRAVEYSPVPCFPL